MEEFTLEFSKFYQGYSPVAHINSLAELGNGGQAGAMVEAGYFRPEHITQGAGRG